MAMNNTGITALLIRALSPAHGQQCEAALSSLRDSDFVTYATSLADHLADPRVPSPARMLAGLMLKNTLDARSGARRMALAQHWSTGISAEVREHVKSRSLAALLAQPLEGRSVQITPDLAPEAEQLQATAGTNALQPGSTSNSGAFAVQRQAAQVVAKIAGIELPHGAWNGLVAELSGRVVGEGVDARVKEASLLGLGYVCEEVAEVAPDAIPASDANLILTAIYQGMQVGEGDIAVRRAGTVALLNALEFVHGNFENDKERDLLMTALCECAAASDEQLQLAAFECLVRVAQLYYDKLKAYMQALFQLTLGAIRGGNEAVAMQGIEFWTTVAEEENEILFAAEEDGADAQQQPGARACEHYTLGALSHLLPVLLECLTKQSEETPDDEVWDLASSAATCIAQVSQCVGNPIIEPVMTFVQANIMDNDWRKREAAIAAFGAILEGPDDNQLSDIVRQGVGIMIERMEDPHPYVKDSSAWALSRICEYFPDVINASEPLLRSVLEAVAQRLQDPSWRVATHACWIINNLSSSFPADASTPEPTNPLSAFFQPLVVELLKAGERPDALEGRLQTAVYETLATLVHAAAQDALPAVHTLIEYTFEKLATALRSDAGSAAALEARSRTIALLSGVMQMIIQKLGRDVVPHAPRLFEAYTAVFASPNGAENEDALQAVSNLALVLEGDFASYLPQFMPVVCTALANVESYQVCVNAVNVTVDLCHAVGARIAPFCDSVVNILLTNLKNPHLDQDVRPPILSCFGDIAFAIGEAYEKYLEVTMSMFAQASATEVNSVDPEHVDYLNALRAGIFQAYTGILHGLGGKAQQLFTPFAQGIIEFIGVVHNHQDKDESVTSAAVALLGDMLQGLGPAVHPLFTMPHVGQFLATCEVSEYGTVAETAQWVKQLIHSAGGSA